MSSAVKRDIWNAWDRSVGVIPYEPEMEEPGQQNTSEFLETPSDHDSGPARLDDRSKRDLRRRRRSRISSNAQIVQWSRVQVNPDVAAIVDASTAGILFVTSREYQPGEELLVRFPFPSSSSPKQKGRVVRVEELPQGQWRVAVRLE